MAAFQATAFQRNAFNTVRSSAPANRPIPSTGGGYIIYDGWHDLFKELPRRKKDEEMLMVLSMFALLEDENNGLF